MKKYGEEGKMHKTNLQSSHLDIILNSFHSLKAEEVDQCIFTSLGNEFWALKDYIRRNSRIV